MHAPAKGTWSKVAEPSTCWHTRFDIHLGLHRQERPQKHNHPSMHSQSLQDSCIFSKQHHRSSFVESHYIAITQGRLSKMEDLVPMRIVCKFERLMFRDYTCVLHCVHCCPG